MFERIMRMHIIIPADIPRNDLDKSFEEVTGKDCDEAAKKMKDKEFEEAIRKAMELLRKKKPMVAIA